MFGKISFKMRSRSGKKNGGENKVLLLKYSLMFGIRREKYEITEILFEKIINVSSLIF